MINSSRHFTLGKVKLAAIVFMVSITTVWSSMLTGVVLDKTNAKPISSAIITANGKEYRTDVNGFFSVPSSGIIGVRAIGHERKFYQSGGKIYLNPVTPKALYLSSFGATSGKIMKNAKYLINNTELNALVIDIKMDRGQIAYKTSNYYANNIGAQKMILFKDLKQYVANLKKDGIYTIARIVSFKDAPFVTAYPQYGVKNSDGSLFKDREGLYWIDPSQKKSWEYITAIAKESAEAGFDEIQFDYVRFPDRKGLRFSVQNTQSERVKTIGEFLRYARSQLIPYNVFVSADIFGYTSWNEGDLAIGQRLDEIIKYVDYISPMLYPSGFQYGIPGYKIPVNANYEIVNHSLNNALKKSGGSPLSYRPWLQAFRDYAFGGRNYGDKEIRDQIRASKDFGSDGWMLWNPRNVYSSDGLSR
ncbi:MAG: putative glycoside hydrolase [Sulfurovaceae bacterium]|nr:putative glycoside hydrolase [Sulfurovaceae bacterium]